MLQVSHFSKFSETLLYKNKKISYLFKNNGKKIDEIPPTMEQINKIEKMGIRIKPKENIIDVFIKELEKLQSIEIDVSKIQVTDTILDLIKKTKPKKNSLNE